jgi:hypothetical protein
MIDVFPDIVPTARASRAFMRRAVRYMAESGIRQIVDIGTGIPTAPSTHQVAHAVAPEVRVAYIDNDPIVAAHAGSHLLGVANTGFFLADLRDPQTVLGHPTIGKLIDLPPTGTGCRPAACSSSATPPPTSTGPSPVSTRPAPSTATTAPPPP